MDKGYTNTEKALMLLAETFYEYAQKGKDGDNNQLDKEETDMLLREQLIHFVDKTTFEDFDSDSSGSVDFSEFMRHLAVIGNKIQNNVKDAIQHQNA